MGGSIQTFSTTAQYHRLPAPQPPLLIRVSCGEGTEPGRCDGDRTASTGRAQSQQGAAGTWGQRARGQPPLTGSNGSGCGPAAVWAAQAGPQRHRGPTPQGPAARHRCRDSPAPRRSEGRGSRGSGPWLGHSTPGGALRAQAGTDPTSPGSQHARQSRQGAYARPGRAASPSSTRSQPQPPGYLLFSPS